MSRRSCLNPPRMQPVTDLTYPHIVVATITDDVGPIDRGAKYQDPLDAILQPAGLGEVPWSAGSAHRAARRPCHQDPVPARSRTTMKQRLANRLTLNRRKRLRLRLLPRLLHRLRRCLPLLPQRLVRRRGRSR